MRTTASLAAALLLPGGGSAAMMAAEPTPRKLKVLCLHGYGQNGGVLRDRSGGFRKPMKKSNFEMTYADGPYGCTAKGEDQIIADADLMKRAWWRGHSGQATYSGWTEARASLGALWDAEEFDGVIGFSQGAAAAAMLAAERQPAFAILVAGFVPKDEDAAAALLSGSSVRSLHVIGDGDEQVVPERSRALAELFADASVVSHPGGHMIPSGPLVRASMVEFLDPVLSALQRERDAAAAS